MFEEINNQLTELKIKLRQKLHWECNLEILTQQYKQQASHLEHLHHQLKQEQKDVDQLTGLSFGAFFYSLIGKKEEQLSKETEELLQAKIKYDETVETVKELEEEIAEIKGHLNQVSDWESEMADKLAQKERMIREQQPELTRQLIDLTDRQTELKANHKELLEAVVAGKSAVGHLKQAEEKLDSASSWGTWDMLGGGMISTAMKHSRINDAREAIHNAQKGLRRFDQELRDVQRESQITIQIGEMLTFADFFFDNIITDWIVQDRLSTSLQQVKDKRLQVEKLVSDLNAESLKLETELGELSRKSIDLIENA